MNMDLVIAAGSGNPALADAIADRLGTSVCRAILNRFPDTELHAEIEQSVRGCDVYLVQPTGPPVDTHLMELLFMADACRRAGAARITAVTPYFGYARQDRRARSRRWPAGRGPDSECGNRSRGSRRFAHGIAGGVLCDFARTSERRAPACQRGGGDGVAEHGDRFS